MSAIKELAFAKAIGGGGGGGSAELLAKIVSNDLTGIDTLVLPDEITTLKSQAFTFRQGPTEIICTNVNTISNGPIFPSTNFTVYRFPKLTSVTLNGAYPFASATSGSEIYMDVLETIPNNLFVSSNAKKIYLPAAVTIGTAFQGLYTLEEIYIGPNCTSVANYAFGGAGTSGKTITINCGFSEGTIQEANWLTGFSGTPVVNYNVPAPTE